jgi:hypothetical protein
MRIQKAETTLQIPRLGKVKVGTKAVSKNGKEYPKSIDYFRFTSQQQSRVDKCAQLYGEKPQSLRVTFHSNDPADVCVQRYELRNSAGQLAVYGDGNTFYESTATGWTKHDATTEEGQQAVANLRKKYGGQFQESLTLRFVLIGFPEMGVWEFYTKGKDTSIPSIIGTFDSVLNNAGRVVGVPFDLTVEMHKSNRANANRQYPVVSLICNFGYDALESVQEYGEQLTGLVTAEKIKQLQSPNQESNG